MSTLAGPCLGNTFVIQVNYSGDPTYQSAFDDAATMWTGLIAGYQNGVVTSRTFGSSYNIGQTVGTLFIDASVAPIDGVGGVLGSAGPDQRITDQAGFVLATDGTMNFDSADILNLFNSGRLSAVIAHEMAHVMGFGTLWTNNGVYVNGSGEFTGAAATAKWHSEFGQTGTPNVELGGGPGTANGHWDEVDGGGGSTGILDPLGRDMRLELMTGWIGSTSFVSEMTVASFVDIGFVAVPEPLSSLAILALVPYFVTRRQRVAR